VSIWPIGITPVVEMQALENGEARGLLSRALRTKIQSDRPWSLRMSYTRMPRSRKRRPARCGTDGPTTVLACSDREERERCPPMRAWIRFHSDGSAAALRDGRLYRRPSQSHRCRHRRGGLDFRTSRSGCTGRSVRSVSFGERPGPAHGFGLEPHQGCECAAALAPAHAAMTVMHRRRLVAGAPAHLTTEAFPCHDRRLTN
jgi:hypothetical protein